jgi:RNA polymerase sigma-70 factor, ECF subfamily
MRCVATLWPVPAPTCYCLDADRKYVRSQMSAGRRNIPLHIVPSAARADVDDATLARALVAGEPWAHPATWNRFAPLVFNMAWRALGSEEEAEDITQEVFYRLFARVNTLCKPESLRSFIVSFAIRILKWEFRRKRAGRWLAFFTPKDLPDVPFRGSDPEAREILQRFYKILDQLGTRERLVFALRHLESMTLGEIAAAMEISLSTVKRAHAQAVLQVGGWIASDKDLAGFLEEVKGTHGT